MELTTKARYGVRIMADLARNKNDFVSITDISKRQDISCKYIEKIIAMLKKDRLVESTRGTNGGYRLSRPASEISVGEILRATGDNSKLVKCLEEHCPRENHCDTKGVWNTLDKMITDYLNSVMLADLIK